MPYTAPITGKKIELATDFLSYFKLQTNWHTRPLVLLPNLSQLSPEQALEQVAAHWSPRAIHMCYAVHPFLNEYDPGHIGTWARVFLHTLQSGNLTGTGLIVFGRVWHKDCLAPYAATFALCLHKNQYLPTAKPHLGLHDQFCTECGLDTSYDSSD